MYRIVFTLLMVGFAPQFLIAGTLDEERTKFLQDLTQLVMQSQGPVEYAPGGQWSGVLLCPIGTVLSPNLSSYDAIGADRANVAQTLADSSLFDRSLSVRNGVGTGGQELLSEVWKSILEDTMPSQAIDESALTKDTRKWLFRTADRVDKIRGVDYVAEPSEFFLRYREYELLYGILISARRIGKPVGNAPESWKLHSRLKNFGSAAEALASVEQDWIQFGHKSQIEDAKREYFENPLVKDWRVWTEANAVFEAESSPLGRNGHVHVSQLSPAPTEWAKMGSWATVVVDATNKKSISFQIARIQIVRPWFKPELLVSDRLRFPKEYKGEVLSTGEKPTLTVYPTGRVSVYATELILVRQIRTDAAAEIGNHPLLVFADPDRIQLLGYVVRALPKLPK